MMRATNLKHRVFERSPGLPFSRSKEVGGETPTRKFQYERLMQVTIKHDYYNLSNPVDTSSDFIISPTAASSLLMNDVGLLFKAEATGFSVLYDAQRKDMLLQYLRRQVENNECWARLSFVLSLNNPYFMNFTALPLALNPASQNFYLTNQKAHINAAGDVVFDWSEKESLLPVVPVQFVVPKPRKVNWKSVREVHALDISGQVVMCTPRCVPVDVLKNKSPADITCKEAQECKDSADPKCQCADSLYLNFSSLPEDKYTIALITFSGSESISQEVLYTVAHPTPLCFIDLLFASPIGENPEFYPVQDLVPAKGDKTEVRSIHYELKFEARKTFWNYYVVPPLGATIKNLAIEGEPAVKFAGPWTIDLPNGLAAYRFISKRSLPFRQESPFRFRLLGELNASARHATLVDRLPVPPVEQVLQDEVAACLGLDQMMTASAKGERRKLETLLCQCLSQNFGTGLRADERLVRIKQMCGDSQSKACRELKRGCSKIYSDTYVYV